MTRLAASRRAGPRPSLDGYRRTIPIEMRIRMSTMAGTFIPPSRLPSCWRLADLHLKLKSRVPGLWASYAALHHVRPRLSTRPIFLFRFSSLSSLPIHPSSLPSVLAARTSHVNMHELSGARPGWILKQKSCRPVHSSARPDVFALRRTVYSRGKGNPGAFECSAAKFI